MGYCSCIAGKERRRVYGQIIVRLFVIHIKQIIMPNFVKSVEMAISGMLFVPFYVPLMGKRPL